MVTSVGDDEREREREKERESSKGVLRNAPAAVGFISDLCLTSSLSLSLFPTHCVSRGVVVSNFLLFFSFDSFFILPAQTQARAYFSLSFPIIYIESACTFLAQIAHDVILFVFSCTSLRFILFRAKLAILRV